MPRVTQLVHTDPGLECKCPGSLLPKPAHDTRLPPRSDVTVPAIMASEEWKVRPLFHGQRGSQIRRRCSKRGCVHPRQVCWTCRTDLFTLSSIQMVSLDRGSEVQDRQNVPFPQKLACEPRNLLLGCSREPTQGWSCSSKYSSLLVGEQGFPAIGRNFESLSESILFIKEAGIVALIISWWVRGRRKLIELPSREMGGDFLPEIKPGNHSQLFNGQCF